MSTIEVHGLDRLEVSRTEDEIGAVVFTIHTEDGTIVRLNAGRNYDDADTLADALADAAKDAAAIVSDWKDLPDEYDGYVFDSGRDGYYAQLDGTANPSGRTRDGHTRYVRGFPTRDIATYELAKMMVDAGCFPNAWYQDERGWTEDIGDAVRAFHDDGGDKLLPLEGVEYAEGAEARIDGLRANVICDYGKFGILYYLSGDDETRFIDDRSEVERIENDEDEDED